MQPAAADKKLTSEPVAGKATEIREWIALSVATLAAAMRLWQLGAKSLWLDEAASIEIARWDLHSVVRAVHQPAGAALFYWYQSLYYFLLHFLLGLGDSEFLVRLPSAILGIATVVMLYFVAANLFSRRVAWMAALFLAFHPFHLAYSQEARGYAFCVFLVTASYALLVAALEEGSARVCAVYAAVTAAAIYSHLYAALILPAQFIVVMASGSQHRRRLVFALVATGLLTVPIFWLALTQNAGQNDWTPPLSARDILHAAQQLIGTGIRFPIGLGLLALAGISWFRKAKPVLGWREGLVWSWFLVPALGIVIISAMAPPFAPRYLLLCLPACVMLLAVGLDRLPAPRIGNAAAVVLALLFFSSSLSYYRKPKEDWRGAAAVIARGIQAGDRILFDREYGRIPVNYYMERTAPEFRPEPITPLELNRLPASQRLWVVLYGPAHRDQKATEQSLPAGFRLFERQDFGAITVLLYSRLSSNPQ